MKKLISLMLALVCFACCFGAAAEEQATEDFPQIGMKFTYPQEVIDAKGTISTDGAFELGQGIYFVYWYYAAMTPDEFNRMVTEDPDQMGQKVAFLCYTFAVPAKKDFSAVIELTGDLLDAANATEIGRAGDWTFYLYMTHDPEFSNNVDQEYYDEYTALCGMKDKIAASFTFSEPYIVGYAEITDGGVLRFMATDLDGNPLSSEDIFSQHKMTMVNIWATWCGPCVGELGELQKIHTKFLEKDCAIVGLMTDKDIDEARRLMNENGITYLVVLAPDNLTAVFPYEGIPTSFFVDRNGVIRGETITGAYPNLYESGLEQALEAAR